MKSLALQVIEVLSDYKCENTINHYARIARSVEDEEEILERQDFPHRIMGECWSLFVTSLPDGHIYNQSVGEEVLEEYEFPLARLGKLLIVREGMKYWKNSTNLEEGITDFMSCVRFSGMYSDSSSWCGFNNAIESMVTEMHWRYLVNPEVSRRDKIVLARILSGWARVANHLYWQFGTEVSDNALWEIQFANEEGKQRRSVTNNLVNGRLRPILGRLRIAGRDWGYFRYESSVEQAIAEHGEGNVEVVRY